MDLICNSIPLPILDPFIGCDGKPWSDELLQSHIDKAVYEEDYRWAVECRDELARRKSDVM